jgi:hypothetical protein
MTPPDTDGPAGIAAANTVNSVAVCRPGSDRQTVV